ncbi:MAG: DUF3179 domain-containing (seleno)protein [Bacteroidales bacterium]
MRTTFLFILLIIFYSCEQEDEHILNYKINQYYWRVDTMEMSGTVIRPTFPVITQVEYVEPSSSALDLYNESRILITLQGKSVFAYPLSYMHIEVLNQFAGEKYFAVTYCPITRSAMIWNREIGEEILTLAASGVLYKENLVIYDIEHEQFWSQMLISKIYGNRKPEKPEMLSSFETDWQTVKNYFPNAKVFNGIYNNISDSFLHSALKNKNPGTNDNNNYNLNYNEGEKIYGILLPGEVITYSHNAIENDMRISEYDDIVVVSSAKPEFIVSFYTSNLELSIVKNDFPIILMDQNNNKYDVFGKPVNNSGISPLLPTNSYSASWWAWKSFFDSFSEIK